MNLVTSVTSAISAPVQRFSNWAWCGRSEETRNEIAKIAGYTFSTAMLAFVQSFRGDPDGMPIPTSKLVGFVMVVPVFSAILFIYKPPALIRELIVGNEIDRLMRGEAAALAARSRELLGVVVNIDGMRVAPPAA